MWSYCLLGVILAHLGLLVSAGYIGEWEQFSSQEFPDDEFCAEGTYENEAGACVPCTRCSAGEGELHPCGRFQDRQCKPCHLGYSYSVEMSDTNVCFPCTHCQNQQVLRQCTLTNNTVCGECRPGYFYDDLTRSCLRCSYCDLESAVPPVRILGCSSRPRDFQCYPSSTAGSEPIFIPDELAYEYGENETLEPMNRIAEVEFRTTTPPTPEVDSELMAEVQRLADQAEEDYRQREEQLVDIEDIAIETDAFLAASLEDEAFVKDHDLVVSLQTELTERLHSYQLLLVIVSVLLALCIVFSAVTFYVVMRMRRSMSESALKRAHPRPIYKGLHAVFGTGSSKVSSQLLSSPDDPLEFR